MAEKPKRNTKSKRTATKTNEKLWPRIVLIVIWLLVGLYFGMAGWSKIYYNNLEEKAAQAREKVDCTNPAQGVIYKGIQFCTNEDMRAFQHLEQMENTGMTWGLVLPDPFPMVFSAFAFGVVGSIVNIFRMIAGKKGMPNLHVVLTDPPLGGLTALMVLGLSALMPSIFTNANILLTPAVQPFLSLFAGAFSEPILKWIQVKLNKILKTQKESE